MAATVTRKKPKKETQKKATPRKEVARRVAGAAPAKNGKVKTGPASADKFDTDQKPLDGMEDVDERVPALEDECQRYFSECNKIMSGREGKEASKEKIGKLLREHELDCYIKNGRKFFFEPSKETIRVKKVRQS